MEVIPQNRPRKIAAPYQSAVGPQTQPVSAEPKAPPKRKVVRRDPEKRRQQNLQAQKKYREKVRKRLDDLETLAASIAQSRQQQPSSSSSSSSSPPPPPPPPHAAETTPQPVISAATAADSSLATPSDSQQSTSPDSVSSLDCVLQDPTRCNEQPSTQQNGDGFTNTIAGFSLSRPVELPSKDLSLSAWDSRTFVDPANLFLPSSSTAIDTPNKPQAERWYTSYVDCGCATRHVEVRSQHPDPSNCRSVRLFSIGASPLATADPYTNHLRLEMHCTISAMWTNALHLGVTEIAMCEDESVSPFYRPGPASITADGEAATTPANESVVATVQSIFRSLKPDLRPTRQQITILHHPCVDIFPFPTLRNNILALGEDFDDYELFYDMMNGALVCWGLAGGFGRKSEARNTGNGSVTSGSPWDYRSWEAKPWFLRKYWALLGGEEGELVRQSEWWREMRDEEEEVWPGVVMP